MYDPGQSTFTSSDPFAGFPETPYSLHPYQYGYSNPMLWTDPSGACVAYGNNDCAFIRIWADLAGWFPYAYPHPPAESARLVSYRGGPIPLHAAAEWAAWCDVVTFTPGRYPNTSAEFIQAEAFAVNVLGFSLLNSNLTNDPDMLLDELQCLESRRDDLTQDEHIRRWQILVALGMAVGQDGIDNLDLPRGGGARGPRFAGGGGGGVRLFHAGRGDHQAADAVRLRIDWQDNPGRAP
ncbi:MAG: hypothetical protein MI924_30450 [Chloroflexales bacterium]|nr:hypothetical protein [Chloroflexales bacterium]